ncbi:MAG: universal stress protein [Gemmatimonadota bacterium]|nr:universal stress protein [Gemmatimonadota bacterium]MDH3422146.1 universal stress protein [Gemmatimonadota bacterium]
MIKRILVPVDGSQTAEAALQMAIGLGNEMGAEVRLALVREVSDQPLEDYLDTTTEVVRRQLVSDGAFASSVFLEGRVAPALCSEAEAADLVVMSSHGRGGFERMWVGSVTDAVLRQCSVPILVVKPGNEDVASSFRPFTRIAVPLDGSDAAKLAVEWAVELAGRFGASVTLFRVASPVGTVLPGLDTREHATELVGRLEADARTDLEAVRSEVDDGSCPVDVAVRIHRSPARGILEFVDESAADLVVIVAQTRYPLKRAMLGSVADKVIRGSATPVLVVRSWKEETPPLGEG